MIQILLNDHIIKKGYSIWVENIDPSAPNFAELRNKGFGASDSSILLGVNPFNTIEQLMEQKKHHIFDDSIGRKASVRKGADLEDLLIHKVAKVTGRNPFKPPHMYGHDETGLTVNFDGVSEENGLLIPDEIKVCTHYGRKYYNFAKSILEADYEVRHKPHNDKGIIEFPLKEGDKYPEYINKLADNYGIPAYYFTQLQQQMFFLDAPYGYLNVMDDLNWCLHSFKIYRHQEVINWLLAIAKSKYLELQVFRGELKTEYEDF